LLKLIAARLVGWRTSLHIMKAGRAPLAACAAMSARIAPKRTITPPEWTLRSTMINAIGAMHAVVRAKKRPEDKINFRVEVKKRRRKPEEDKEDERPRRARLEHDVST
jgi:hypothetical protein